MNVDRSGRVENLLVRATLREVAVDLNWAFQDLVF